MDKIKNKYEIILGFVTLIISFSAFKEELSNISLELGYSTISLSKYFLICVIVFAVSLYLYIIENISRDTFVGKWKVFDYILKFAYILFVLVIISPLILFFNIVLYKIYNYFTVNYTQTRVYIEVLLSFLSGMIGLLTSLVASKQILRLKKKKLQEETEEQEIRELENANKLFKEGYYSHSILEAFKVLETHLFKKLTEQDVRVSRHRINDIISLAIKNKIISQSDITYIDDLKGMRNAAAHTDIGYTKEQAKQALKFVKDLFAKNQPHTSHMPGKTGTID